MADPSGRDPFGGDSPLFPSGFGHFDRPARPPADPTAEPATDPAAEPVPPAVPEEPIRDAAPDTEPEPPPPPPIPPGLPPETPDYGPAQQPPRPRPRRVSRWGWVTGLAMAMVIAVPSMLALGDAYFSADDHDVEFPEFDGGTEPLTADELYSEPSYTFEVTLSDRVLTGELHLVEAFDHPDCVSAALDNEVRDALSECEHRIEAAYEAEYEGVRVSQQVLMFADQPAAESFASQIEDEFVGWVLSFAHLPDFGEDFDEDAYAGSRLGTQGKFVVLTVMVADSDDDETVEVAQDHAHVRHAESLSYFLWR